MMTIYIYIYMLVQAEIINDKNILQFVIIVSEANLTSKRCIIGFTIILKFSEVVNVKLLCTMYHNIFFCLSKNFRHHCFSLPVFQFKKKH